MVLNLADKYCGDNNAARNELIGLGYETIAEFAAEKLVTDESELKFDNESKPLNMLLTLETIESKELRLAVFGILKNRIRNYALRASKYSPVFPEFFTDSVKRRYTAISYGNMSASDADEDSLPGEFCPVEISDRYNETAREMSEILIDASRFLDVEELEIVEMTLEGRSLNEIAMVYGIKSSSMSYRINKIAKKLAPLGESLKACA